MWRIRSRVAPAPSHGDQQVPPVSGRDLRDRLVEHLDVVDWRCCDRRCPGAAETPATAGSDRGALSGLLPVGFPGPPAEPAVRLAPQRALHVSCRLVSRWRRLPGRGPRGRDAAAAVAVAGHRDAGSAGEDADGTSDHGGTTGGDIRVEDDDCVLDWDGKPQPTQCKDRDGGKLQASLTVPGNASPGTHYVAGFVMGVLGLGANSKSKCRQPPPLRRTPRGAVNGAGDRGGSGSVARLGHVRTRAGS